MVINVGKLMPNEFNEDFKRLYTEYFRSIVKNEANDKWYSILSFLGLSKCEAYADEMINKIQNGERIGFVSISGYVYNGLIIGRVYEDAGWISHLYVKPGLDFIQQKIIAYELYKEMALEFKKLGKNKIQIEVSKSEKQFINTLIRLGFIESSQVEETSIYERTI